MARLHSDKCQAQRFDALTHFYDGLFAQFLVGHNTTRGNLLARQFELRLDQNQEVGVLFRLRNGGPQHFAGRNKGNVDNDDGGFLGKLPAVEFPRISLDSNDARILPQFPVNLFCVDINGVDTRGAVLQETIREPPCRRADVQTNTFSGVDRELSKRAFQFDAAAADELLGPVCQFDLRVSGDGGAGFVGPLAVYLDFTREDHGKSFLQRPGNPALDEENIQPLANRFGFHNAFETSGAAKNEEFRNFTKPRSTFPKGRELRSGFRGEIVGNGVRAFEAVHGRIGRLFLGDVLARGFSKRGRRLLDVQDVVGNLKCPADGLSEAAKARDIVVTCAGAQSARRDGCTDERSGFRAMNVFQHLRLDALAFRFNVSD